MTRARVAAPNRSDRYRLVAAIFAQGFGLSAVIPLFPLYEDRFGVSNAELTAVFAFYAFSLIPSLLIVGPRSDAVGRKRVLIPAMVVLVLGSVVFAAAQNVWWLFAARLLQGISNGAFWGAVTAWVRDLTPDERREDATLVVSTTFPGATAVGALVSGLIATTTASIVLPWLVHAGLVVVAIVLVAGCTETVDRSLPRPGRAMIRLPAGNQAAFLGFVAPVTFALIALGATVMALIPAMLSEVGSGSAAALSGVGVAVVIAVSSVVQPFLRRITAYRTTWLGSLISVVGAAAIAAAVGVGSAAALLVALLILGTGNGFCFKGTLALAERLSTAKERAAVISAYNIAMYLGLSLPALAAGYASEVIGLAPTLAALGVISTAIIAAAFSYGRGHLPDHLRPATVGRPAVPT